MQGTTEKGSALAGAVVISTAPYYSSFAWGMEDSTDEPEPPRLSGYDTQDPVVAGIHFFVVTAPISTDSFELLLGLMCNKRTEPGNGLFTEVYMWSKN